MTDLTSTEIAVVRSRRIDDPIEREAFLSHFSVIRNVATTSPDPELIWFMAQGSDIAEAACIEAFASLRAEGYRL